MKIDDDDAIIMKIALDLDGVLADVLIPWIVHTNTVRHTSMSKRDITDWMFWKKLKIPREQFYTELAECWRNWHSIPPTEPGLANSTKDLSSLGSVDIVTAREPGTDIFVKRWLAHHGIIYDRYVSVATGIMKADLNYDVFIDDSPVNAHEFVKRGKRVIVYSQPWNVDCISEKMTLVTNMAGAVSIISR